MKAPSIDPAAGDLAPTSTDGRSQAPGAPGAAPAKRSRARLLFLVKLLGTAAALAFTFSRLSLSDLAGAVARMRPSAVAIAIALTFANFAVAGVRWRILLAAYGAPRPPAVAFLSRANLVGHFYNTFVPGNVTGDVLRGHVTRGAFDGPLGSYMVVAQERFFGLAGLFTLGAVGLLLRPLPGVVRADLLAALAFVTALLVALFPLVGRGLGRRLPGRLGRFAAGVPVPARPGLLGVVLLLGVVTHGIVAVTGHVLVNAIAPQVALNESIVLVPLAMIAVYVPFSVAGLGVREAAFVFLFGGVGVRAADATAASLSFFAVYAIAAAIGGLVHLARPLAPEGRGDPP